MTSELSKHGENKTVSYQRDEDGALIVVAPRWEDPRIKPKEPVMEIELDGDDLHVEMTLLG